MRREEGMPGRDGAAGPVGAVSPVGKADAPGDLPAQLAALEQLHRELFETMPYGVVHHDASGAIVAVNPAAAELLGVEAEALLGLRPEDERWEAVGEDGAALPGAAHPAMVALRTGLVSPITIMGVRHGRTGERRWLSVRGVPLERDERGRPRRAYVLFRDVTEQRADAAALAEQDRFLRRLRDANIFGVVVADETGVRDANEAFLQMIGRDRADLEEGRLDWRSITVPDGAVRDAEALAELRRDGACRPFAKEYVHADGTRVPVLVGAAAVGREPLRWVTFVADLSERRRAEQEGARLRASAEAARAEAARAEEELGLLLRAGALASAMREPAELLEHASRLLVPSLADLVLVLGRADEDGEIRPLAALHRDLGRSARAVVGTQPVPPEERGLMSPLLTGRAQVLEGLSDPAVRAATLGRWSAQVVGGLEVDRVVAVPLGFGRRSRGVLVLGRSGARRAFSASDVAVAEELGRRLAVGLGNAEASAREHRVSETLQRALLPERLPQVAGVDLAVQYLPATAGLDVGGDWFDVVALGEATVGLAIGDVMGHAVATGAVMGQLRTILRTYALDAADPAVVLERTNRAMTRLLPEALATACYAVLDRASGSLAYASAGHPPPLRRDRAGSTGYLDGARGLMLGVQAGARYVSERVELAPEEAVVLYTDGLVEDRQRDLETGLGELEAVVRSVRVAGAAELCDEVLRRLLGPRQRADDVCLLVVRRDG